MGNKNKAKILSKMQVTILEQKTDPTKGEQKMIKELVIGLGYIIIITIILYPVSTVFADLMLLVMTPNILTTILIGIVRYFGFFIGIGTINWVYKGLNLQQQSQYGGF